MDSAVSLTYLIRFAVIMLASAFFSTRSSLFICIPKKNRFILGMCATPVVISLNVYLVGLIWKGAPVWVVKYPIAVLSIAYIALACRGIQVKQLASQMTAFLRHFFLSRGLKLLIWDCLTFCFFVSVFVAFFLRKQIEQSIGPNLFKGLIVTLSILLFLIVSIYFLISKKTIGINNNRLLEHSIRVILIYILTFLAVGTILEARTAIYKASPDHDEAHYCVQARIFRDNRDSLAIDNYKGNYEGTVLSDDHGPLWATFIADAYFYTDGIYGKTVKLAYVITGILFLLLIYNIGDSIGNELCGFAMLFIVFMYSYVLRLTLLGWREPFRFIALYIWLAYIYNKICILYKKKDNPEGRFAYENNVKGILLLFLESTFFAYIGMNGHGSNIVIMLSVFIMYTAMSYLRRTGWKSYLAMAGGTLLGVIICFSKSVKRYFDEGAFTSSTSWAFRGTLAFEKTAAEEKTSWMTIAKSLTYAEYIVLIMGIISALFLTWQFIRTFRGKNAEREPNYENKVVCIMCFSMLLPLTKIYDWLGYSFSMWLVANARYRLHYVIVISIIISIMIAYVNIKEENSRKGIFIKALVICFGIISMWVTSREIHVYNELNDADNLGAFYSSTCDDIVENMKTEGNIFASREPVQFFFKIPTKLGCTEFFHPLYIADNYEEIEAAIDKLDVELFVFSNKDQYYHYDALPFFEYLNSSSKVTKKEYNYSKEYSIIAYKVDDKVWR